MKTNPFEKAALLCAVITIAAIASWEIYLRQTIQLDASYDEGKPLWTHARKNVYGDAKTKTVFIGSSRIKYDLDIDTWKSVTGEDAVQLAIEGNSPLPILSDLAADENFKGKLVIDVTEGLFFSRSPFSNTLPKENIQYFKDETPAQKVSFALNRFLESQFVFLDKENFSLNAGLDQLRVKSRPGVFVFPVFPFEFGRVTFQRQTKMNDAFVRDTALHAKVTDIWKFFASMNTEKPASGKLLDEIIAGVKADADKIRSRGGQVLFIRTPSSGPYWEAEKQGFPRAAYWDVLLTKTGAPGIHFTDHPGLSGFVCPEWSHLKPSDAVAFTKAFVNVLEEKGWRFANSSVTKL